MRAKVIGYYLFVVKSKNGNKTKQLHGLEGVVKRKKDNRVDIIIDGEEYNIPEKLIEYERS